MGMVSEPGESVAFSENVQIGSRLAPDPDFNRPILVFYIDLTSVTDVGSSTGTMYVISAREVVQRPFASAHKVESTFPFFKNTTTGISSARSEVCVLCPQLRSHYRSGHGGRGHLHRPNFPK
jgi:hypothetical protein